MKYRAACGNPRIPSGHHLLPSERACLYRALLMRKPSPRKLRIIFLEDEAKDFSLVQRGLERGGIQCDLIRVASHRQFLDEVARPPDIILSDHHLPEFDGFAALKLAREKCPDVPFVFVTGSVNEEQNNEAARLGASDIVLKNELATSLIPAINHAQEIAEERKRRREAENAWRQSEERYRRLVDLLPCSVIIHRNRKIILANKSAIALLGANSVDQLIGRDIRDFVPQEYQTIVGERLGNVEHGMTVPFIEEKILRLDGTQVSVEVAGSPAVLPDEPDQAAIMVVAIDTTERVAAREQIERLNADLEDRVRRRTAELEITVRELEAFSYSVSHDLRAPLRHIDGFADLLRQSAGNQLDAASREYLNIVTESAREMGKLIEALLSFSRLARAHLGGTPVKLRQLLDGILHDLRYELEGRQIQWTLGDLPEVYGDSTLLRQVLFNLLSNSIKYTRPRAVAKIEVGATHNPTEHIIFVKDNGVGFDMEFASKLFGVFQRLHPSADFEGIGIGLANVRRIVQRHGGRTWAEAAPDQGATFYFSLPTSPVPAAELAGTGGT